MAEKKTWTEKYQQVLSKIAELKKEAEADCNFDRTKMEVNFNVTMAICKWLNYAQDWKNTLRALENKQLEIKRNRFEFYKKEFHLSLDNKMEVELFINSDKEFMEINNIYCLVKELIQYIKDVIENLKGKGFEMKRWIDYSNFINGK
jgi:hypothetical protein